MNRIPGFDCAISSMMHSSIHSTTKWDIPLQPQHAQLTYTKKYALNGWNENIKDKTWRWIEYLGLSVVIPTTMHSSIHSTTKWDIPLQLQHVRLIQTQQIRVEWVKWKNQSELVKMNRIPWVWVRHFINDTFIYSFNNKVRHPLATTTCTIDIHSTKHALNEMKRKDQSEIVKMNRITRSLTASFQQPCIHLCIQHQSETSACNLQHVQLIHTTNTGWMSGMKKSKWNREDE